MRSKAVVNSKEIEQRRRISNSVKTCRQTQEEWRIERITICVRCGNGGKCLAKAKLSLGYGNTSQVPLIFAKSFK